VHPQRVHPRFGMTPNEFEQRLILELGARDHVLIRFDKKLKLLTSPHPQGKSTRDVDRRRGVFVDGMYYWNEKLAKAKVEEVAEVRCEMWCGRRITLLGRR